MDFIETDLPGVIVIEPRVFSDNRGYFMEIYHSGKYSSANINESFVQDNVSKSTKGILRGLHYQNPHSQGKLVSVTVGVVYDVAVDIRRGSPTFGKWFGCELTETNKHLIWIPPGFAHGFCVMSDEAIFSYKCTDLYVPEHEHTILWNDPDIGITWPLAAPTLSEKDKNGKPLKAMDLECLPLYELS